MESNDIADQHPIVDALPVRRVLVIEDTLEFAQSALVLEDCKISVAGSLKAAIRLMREQQFDKG